MDWRSGFTDADFLDGRATMRKGEPLHCDVIGGASHWFSYQSPANAILTITTEGSDFDTVLAAYVGSGTDFASLQSVACQQQWR